VTTATGEWYLNLFERPSLNEDMPTAGLTRFDMAVDGCGNTYFVDVDQPDSPVWLDNHDPQGIELISPHLSEFLAALRASP
jgi:hypothetical protein